MCSTQYLHLSDAVVMKEGKKDMLKVSDLAKTAETTPDAIRHYVRMGLLMPSRHPENGYKLFGDIDVKKVKFIRHAKGLGFSLREIKEIIDHSNRGSSPCPTVRRMIEHRIEENRVKLAEMNRLQQRMDQALDRWQSMPDGEPDGQAICHLIESMGAVPSTSTSE